MYNSLFANRKNNVIYFLAWGFIALSQFLVLVYLVGIALVPALADSILFNFTLAFLGRAIWPVTRYARIDNFYFFNSIITLLAATFILLTFWYFSCNTLLAVIFSHGKNSDYVNFLIGTRVIRLLMGSLLFMVLIMIYYLYQFLDERKESELQQAELITNLKQAELDMLKTQLNPHFIFNSLNSVSSLTLIEPKQAQKMVILLSDFLRYALKPAKELVTFKEELKAIEQFLAIEKIRFDDKLNIEIKTKPAFEKLLIPSLILQPLVENAIKFGLHDSLEISKVLIHCSEENNFLKIEIINEYDPKSTLKKGSGVGLKNVRDRLSLIFNNNNLLSTTKTEKEFRVSLLIPKMEN